MALTLLSQSDLAWVDIKLEYGTPYVSTFEMGMSDGYNGASFFVEGLSSPESVKAYSRGYLRGAKLVSFENNAKIRILGEIAVLQRKLADLL